MTAKIITEGWKLQSLNINRSWNSSNVNDYTGKIRFTNAKEEEISFNIPPEKMTQLLEIISDNVVDSARELGAGLVQSMQKAALPPPPEPVVKDPKDYPLIDDDPDDHK